MQGFEITYAIKNYDNRNFKIIIKLIYYEKMKGMNFRVKGFFRWFKSNTKMKRWILLILIGIVLCCYGMAEVLTSRQMEFIDLAKIAAIFVVGFICIIYSIVAIQKRTLEILVEDTDKRMKDEKSNVKSLIFNKRVYNQGPKVVAIGGGSGLNSVLRGLKNYTDNITAIVTVSDYGEQITESRKELEILPLDDIKESIVALSSNEKEMESLMNFKYKTGKLKNLSFSDMYFLAMEDINRDFTEAVKQSEKIFNMTGKVLPVTMDEIKICAELEDGTVIESKNKIPEVINDKTCKISRIFITPSNCKPAPGVIEAIMEADAIVIGPGSLYTNVIPNLLVKGVAKAIKESKAFKVYVSNLMTEPGQTDNYSLSEHIKAINEHVGKGVIEYCLYDTGEIIPEYIRKYNLEGSELVEQDVSKVKVDGVYMIQRHLSHIANGYIRHNPDAIAAAIIQLICDDLKFNNMENNAQYMMLNNKLKDSKKSLKKQTKENKNKIKDNKAKHADKRGKSKFFEKYSDRIESIQESDLKQKEKMKKNSKK